MIFTPTVGVAPGTTTMSLGDCPPDELWRYTVPPQVITGLPSGVVAPASAADVITPGAVAATNPYGTESQLRGLGELTPRWGVVLFAGIATFATVLGISWLRRRRKK
jgi:hypothetical protein